MTIYNLAWKIYNIIQTAYYYNKHSNYSIFQTDTSSSANRTQNEGNSNAKKKRGSHQRDCKARATRISTIRKKVKKNEKCLHRV